jgi:hypothetical protein
MLAKRSTREGMPTGALPFCAAGGAAAVPDAAAGAPAAGTFAAAAAPMRGGLTGMCGVGGRCAAGSGGVTIAGDSLRKSAASALLSGRAVTLRPPTCTSHCTVRHSALLHINDLFTLTAASGPVPLKKEEDPARPTGTSADLKEEARPPEHVRGAP